MYRCSSPYISRVSASSRVIALSPLLKSLPGTPVTFAVTPL